MFNFFARSEDNVLKIVVDAKAMSCRPSGVGTYIYNFLRQLIAYDDFKIVLVTDVIESVQIRFFQESGFLIHCYGKRVFRSTKVLGYFAYVRRVLLKEQPDLFWEPNMVIPIPLYGFHGKVAVTIHDLFPITEPKQYSKLYQCYFRYGLRMALKQADGLLFVSKETQKETEVVFPESRSKEKFVCFSIVPASPARTIVDDNYFLYIGNLELRKGTDILLRAYRCYRKKGGKKPLILAGAIKDEFLKAMLEMLQKEFKEVVYSGYVQEKEKYDLLASCSCFLFPSRAEGFGVPPLEALSYGKPVITSELSIFKEILKLPVPMFCLECSLEKQAEQLAMLMLADHSEIYSKEDCVDVLEYYRADLLGENLSHFFIELVGGKNGTNSRCL